MSLLTILQNVCAELALPQPSIVISSIDPTIIQMRILAQREGDDYARAHDWSDLRVQRTFVSTGPGLGLPEPSEPPADWERMANKTDLWNVSRRLRCAGPVGADIWERDVVIGTNPTPQHWRMLGGNLAVHPNISGETYRYEYVSKNWIAVNGGTTYSAAWANDTDTSRLSERIIELGVLWRWKKAKGLDYAEEMKTWSDARESDIGSDRASSPFSLSRASRGAVPDNYWPGVITVV